MEIKTLRINRLYLHQRQILCPHALFLVFLMLRISKQYIYILGLCEEIAFLVLDILYRYVYIYI